MTCKNCGIEIADKAIVCYRCGTATTQAVRKPAEIRSRRGANILIVILVLLALLALFFGYEYHVFGVELIVPSSSLDSAYTVDSAYSVAVLIDLPALYA